MKNWEETNWSWEDTSKENSSEENNNEENNIESKIEELREYRTDQDNFWPLYRKFLHIALLCNYEHINPEKMSIINSLTSQLIPCPDCQEHFQKMIEEEQYDFDSFIEPYWAAKYFHKLHNIVNERTDKPILWREEYIEQEYQNIQDN